MGIIFLIIGVAIFSISNVLWKKAIFNADFKYVIFVKSAFTSLFFGSLLIFNEIHNIGLDLKIKNFHSLNIHLLYTIILCVFSFYGLFFYLKSLEQENPSITIAVSSINLFGILTSFIILGEIWKNVYYIVFALILISIILLYKQTKDDGKYYSIKYAIIASFFWGVSYTLFKIPIEEYGAILFTFILESTIALFSFLFYIRRFDQFKNISKKYLLYIVACSILSSYFFHASYLYLDTINIIIFQKFSIPLSLIISYYIFKEKIGWIKFLAIICIFISLIISSFYV